jgi:hypothetical protein
MSPRLPHFVPFVALCLLVATSAFAHEHLDEPANRYDDQKGGEPCGMGGALDNRTTRVTAYEPGATITVRWTEEVDHVGSFRIAFDPDGADQSVFNQHVLATLDDPSGTGGKQWSQDVTLPNTPCENCTLQVEQIMTTSPFPTSTQTYHQCADIALRAGGGGFQADAGIPASNGNVTVGGGCTQASTTSLPLGALAALCVFVARRRRAQ